MSKATSPKSKKPSVRTSKPSGSTKFQEIHKSRQEYRGYRKYREEHRPRVFKIAVLLLAMTLSILSFMIMPARNNTPELSSKINNLAALPALIAIDNLNGQKLVALTFDDGPDPHTSALLDVLKQEKVTVTFFVLGSRADRYSDTVRRAYQEGHQIASHTYTHKNLTRLSSGSRQVEVNGAIVAIERITGARPTVIRPPYGAWNTDVMNDAGMPLVLWSVDTEDWRDRNVERIYQHVMTNVRNGSIVLMHDLYPSTIEAVTKIIPALKAQSYNIVTVNRLIMARGGSFASGHYYRYLYP